MERFFLVAGAAFGFISVAMGAFGAHALQARLEPRDLEIIETGVRYQLGHAVVLLVVALLLAREPSGWLIGSGWAFTAGILVFSGSLYLLVLTGFRGLGAVAPVGGTALLVGWALLAIAGWKLAAGPG